MEKFEQKPEISIVDKIKDAIASSPEKMNEEYKRCPETTWLARLNTRLNVISLILDSYNRMESDKEKNHIIQERLDQLVQKVQELQELYDEYDNMIEVPNELRLELLEDLNNLLK